MREHSRAGSPTLSAKQGRLGRQTTNAFGITGQIGRAPSRKGTTTAAASVTSEQVLLTQATRDLMMEGVAGGL